MSSGVNLAGSNASGALLPGSCVAGEGSVGRLGKLGVGLNKLGGLLFCHVLLLFVVPVAFDTWLCVGVVLCTKVGAGGDEGLNVDAIETVLVFCW